MILLLLACTEPDPAPPPTVATAECDPALDWASFGEGWFATWCTTCHSSSLEGELRGGAPPGIDFDRWEDVTALQDLVAASALGEEPRMPPGGGPTDAQRAALAAWLACGAPGESAVADACAEPTWIRGDVTVGPGDDPCADGNAVDGSVTLAGGSAACLCEVTGDLVAGAPADLPALGAVGGSLTLAADLAADSLVTVGGDLVATADVRLPALASVGGDVRAEGVGVLDLHRLRTVGGDLVVTGGALTTLDGLQSVATVGGALTVADLGGLVELDTLQVLTDVGGPVTIGPLPELRRLAGFVALPRASSLALVGLPALARVEGLTALTAVDGEWAVRGTGLVGSEPLGAVTEVGTLTISANPALRYLGAFTPLVVADRLEITDNPLLPTSIADAFVERVAPAEAVVSGNAPD